MENLSQLNLMELNSNEQRGIEGGVIPLVVAVALLVAETALVYYVVYDANAK